jgi:predicted helicase
MRTFNEIYIIDLHGNSLKKEITPDGGKDQNVFDIRQGTAIAIFIKQKNKRTSNVFHLDQFGLREEKYKWLNENSVATAGYLKIKPKKPWYFFIPRNTRSIDHFQNWKAINEIFPVNVTGIVTARDKLVIDFDIKHLQNRIAQFRNLKIPDEIIKEAYNLKDSRGWKFSIARKNLAKEKKWERHFQKILYRPFDVRYIYYSEKMVDWGRPEFMRQLIEKDNISICFARQYSGDFGYNHFLVSKYMVDNRTFFSAKGIIQQAPLYLYNTNHPPKEKRLQTMMVFEPQVAYNPKTPNINKAIYEQLNAAYKKRISPEEILNYVYAIGYSNVYRKTYDDFLRIDFPRIPFTANWKTFNQMVISGEKLVNLHLMNDDTLDILLCRYQGESESDFVEKVDFVASEQKVFINPYKFFDNIAPDVWNYKIGGYQILKKYLLDRAKAKRDIGDPKHYCKMVTAIIKTIEIQQQIDTVYPLVENDLINFDT